MHRTTSSLLASAAGLALFLGLTIVQPRAIAGPKDSAKSQPTAADQLKDAAKDPQKDAQKDAQQQDPAEPLISKMRIQDYPGAHYFCIEHEVTISQLGEYVPEAMTAMMAAIKENHVDISNASVFVYHNATHDQNKPFKLEIGFPVAEGTKDVGEYKVRELEPFHCASVIYSGPIAQVPQAYLQAFSDIMAAGLQPTGEMREMYLYWEGPESPNNIQIIMIGIAK